MYYRSARSNESDETDLKDSRSQNFCGLCVGMSIYSHLYCETTSVSFLQKGILSKAKLCSTKLFFSKNKNFNFIRDWIALEFL